MSGNHLFIVGAGLSAEPCNLPTDKYFLEINKDCIRSSLYPFLGWALNRLYSNIALDQRSMFDRSTEWPLQGLETVWSEIDANFYSPKFVIKELEIKAIKDELVKLAQREKEELKSFHYYYYYSFESIRNLTPYEILFRFADWRLRQLILEVYGKKRFGLLDDHHQRLYTKLIDNIFNNVAKKTIISFNYDIVLDEAIECRKYLGGIKRLNDDGIIDFIKPHGSINWYQEGSEKIQEKKDPVSVEEIGFKKGQLYQHSIVPPVDRKREFGLEQSGDMEIVEQVYAHNLLEQVEKALLEADAITIIGYSFPIGDQHIRSIMTKVNNLRKEEKRKYIFVRYIDPQANEQKFALESLFYAHKYDFFNVKWSDWIEKQ